MKILDEMARLPGEVERGRRAGGAVCIVAVTPSANVREILNTVLRNAQQTSLDLEILVQEVPTPKQPAALHEARVDIGLCHPFTNLAAEFPDVDYRLLIEDVLDGALLPIGHPLAKRSSITFADLAEIPFVFLSPGVSSGVPRFRDGSVSGPGLSPHYRPDAGRAQHNVGSGGRGRGLVPGFGLGEEGSPHRSCGRTD